MTTKFAPTLEHIGQIAHVGDTYVFGLALHQFGDNENETNVVYLNLAGPTTSVEAVWAALTERRSLVFKPREEGRLRFLKHHRGSKDDPPYIRYQQRIPGLAIDHLILVDRRFKEVEYTETGDAFVFDAPEASLKLADYVRQLVNVAVFPGWFEPLVEAGFEARLIKPLESLGHRVLHINLDRTRWELLISAQLKKGGLSWPA